MSPELLGNVGSDHLRILAGEVDLQLHLDVQFAEAGAGWLIQEKDFDVDGFTKRLSELIMNPDELIGASKIAISMGHPDVASQMVHLIKQELKK